MNAKNMRLWTLAGLMVAALTALGVERSFAASIPIVNPSFELEDTSEFGYFTNTWLAALQCRGSNQRIGRQRYRGGGWQPIRLFKR